MKDLALKSMAFALPASLVVFGLVLIGHEPPWTALVGMTALVMSIVASSQLRWRTAHALTRPATSLDGNVTSLPPGTIERPDASSARWGDDGGR